MTQLIIAGIFHLLVSKNDEILGSAHLSLLSCLTGKIKEIKCLILTSLTVFYALRAEVWNEVTLQNSE